MNYYNEFDKPAAAWLRELIKAGLIHAGDVDERSIVDVKASELAGYTQCHFFAGIGGWSYALRLAGWPDDRPVWTGSCPCQPFSAAGKQKGQADERHLWPHMFRLIRECKPPTVFGEQVEGAVRLGWLDGISGDLEGEGYAVGSHVLGAHSVGAPHIRQRLYWVADAGYERAGRTSRPSETASGRSLSNVAGRGIAGGLAESDGGQCYGKSNGKGRLTDRTAAGRIESDCEFERSSNPWNSFDLLPCTDGKARRIEPGTFPLAHGVPARVGRLRGYGNAIVPQVAAEFIKAAIGIAK